jgi:hypothetical protein
MSGWSKSLLVASLMLMPLINGCNLINPDEPIPSYLKIKEVKVNATALQGSASHKIVDMYVFVNNQLAGAYPALSTFPLLYEGENDFVFSAGIMVNGITAARGIYPFYKSNKQRLMLTPGQITEVNLTFEYNENTVFKWMENFDSPSSGLGFISVTGTGADIEFLPAGSPDIFEGYSSGVVYLNISKRAFDIESSLSFSLPKTGRAIFLEINYQCSHDFEIGLTARYPFSTHQRWYAISVKAKSQWNKLYVDLSSGPSTYNDAADFKLYLKGELKEGDSQGRYLFDNLKILHF